MDQKIDAEEAIRHWFQICEQNHKNGVYYGDADYKLTFLNRPAYVRIALDHLGPDRFPQTPKPPLNMVSRHLLSPERTRLPVPMGLRCTA